MDKKDFNENDKLENGITPEENDASVSTPEEVIEPAGTAPVPQEPVRTAPRVEESVPVMNKVGGGGTPPSSPAPSGGGKGWMIASLVLAAALIVVLIVQPFKKDDSKIAVASVNGTDITKAQLYDKLVEAGGESTLQNLITTTLVGQEAKKANIKVTDADINEEIENLKTQFGGEEALNNALQQSSMTIEDLKKQMPLQVEIRKLVEPKVTVTDDEISKYFEENKAKYNQEEEVRASHILVKTKEEADAIVKQLKEGGDFAALAKEKSADTGSKDKGGDLDFFKRGDMVAEFSDAAFKLKVGETSGAVKSDYGYHIIKVTDRKEAKEYTLAEKKDEIKKTLMSQKVSEMSATWLADLNKNAKITNTLTDKPDASATPAASEAPAAATEAPATEAPATK
ncbi:MULTISPECIES: peptidylprolyl isomerase [Paenibacillus]|uniref:Foldase protein PrsA n=1 Tax=Paenibacillus silagei TaxID=1670801 RepID=A0ABS4NQM0_9BACL|nr:MULTISPECIES: peptidylprolyl isomerase [Paenibacillus]ETT63358.1 PpiC-type peptidyl-prolyl cis-trans isomerase [Paenibacillus sp. FSL R7-277]MBP2112357.1 foldase protein PrsA [Paenibacillus silagei]